MPYTKNEMKQALLAKLTLTAGAKPEEVSDAVMMRTAALVLRDIMAQRMAGENPALCRGRRKVHYLSLEFLMGRSLLKNAFNMGVLQPLGEALEELGFHAGDVFEAEPDAGLGNGGLGRLAACYLDSLTTLEIPAAGYSICYDFGLFRQKITDGQQTELPDEWKSLGGAWLMEKPQETQKIHFGGRLREFWDSGRLHTVPEDDECVLAVPCDMLIAGYETEHMNTLRLWQARAPEPVDMALFSRGEYLKATESRALAESISCVLYPDDRSLEGKLLRLKQQYFFVSATVQDAVKKHVEKYGDITSFAEKNVFQINDTHPAMVIPELMRVLTDDMGLGWEQAWDITVKSVAYTNHTVLSEALERWPWFLVQQLLPRIAQIIEEIAHRWEQRFRGFYTDEQHKNELAILYNGELRMANLCLAGSSCVNGVSALHTDILKRDVFRSAYGMQPEKFRNVTNGVDHRRWLSECNPGLDALIRDCIGDGYLLHPEQLKELERFADDRAALERLAAIKRENKAAFGKYIKNTQGIILNTDAVFDTQVKRLHEYKRQLLNALNIIYLYQQLQDSPNMDFRPHTFLFGAKAAPGYTVAKRIIRLINSLAGEINGNPLCKDRLQVVFLENYRVSLAEKLIPASEVSQQISTAGKEASGTGNMKFMMNGALTVGTLDGANVEMHERLGDGNMFLFGLRAEEVCERRRQGYRPIEYYERDPQLRRVLDALRTGFSDGVGYDDLFQRLLYNDEYLLLADFASYAAAERTLRGAYEDKEQWNRRSLINIARSGFFAADRSVAEYADKIWHTEHR